MSETRVKGGVWRGGGKGGGNSKKLEEEGHRSYPKKNLEKEVKKKNISFWYCQEVPGCHYAECLSTGEKRSFAKKRGGHQKEKGHQHDGPHRSNRPLKEPLSG